MPKPENDLKMTARQAGWCWCMFRQQKLFRLITILYERGHDVNPSQKANNFCTWKLIWVALVLSGSTPTFFTPSYVYYDTWVAPRLVIKIKLIHVQIRNMVSASKYVKILNVLPISYKSIVIISVGSTVYTYTLIYTFYNIRCVS